LSGARNLTGYEATQPIAGIIDSSMKSRQVAVADDALSLLAAKTRRKLDENSKWLQSHGTLMRVSRY
jgi:hypothetical protein